MRIGASRQDDFEINVISLIDVMLTLLMFFVMTTTFVQHSTMKVALPEASELVQETPRSPLVVMIDANSRFYVDNYTLSLHYALPSSTTTKCSTRRSRR